MRKILTILLTSFLLVGIMSNSAFADATKGQKYYLKFLKKKTGMNGAKFAEQHTQAVWKVYFANGGEKFITEYSVKFPKASKFFTNKKFKTKYMKHIADFCIEYASDSGNVPSC